MAGEAVSGTIIHDRFEGVKEAVEGGVLPFPPSAGGEVPAQLGGHALLRALGIPGEHIPDGTEQRAALYRSALAQVVEPVLIIADNASAEAQVRPLLPGPGRC